MIAYRFGYDITTDLYHGLTLVWGARRKKILAFHCDPPKLLWYDKNWHVDEVGYLRGFPVARRLPKKWLLRGIHWTFCLEAGYVDNPWKCWKWWGTLKSV